MKPVLFTVGSFPIPSYYAIITLAIFVGIFIYLYFSRKLKIDDKLSIDSAIVLVATAFPGARLFHVLFEMPSFYLKHPLKIFAVWEGGFVFYGSIFLPLFALLLFLYFKKELKSLFKITDATVIALSMGSFIGRWACFFQGCCYGRVSKNLPWAITFTNPSSSAPIGLHLHPTQLYMSFYNVLIFLVLVFIFKKFYQKNSSGTSKVTYGVITFIYFILYSISRFIVEYYRADFRGNLFSPYLSTSQFISLIVILSSSFAILFLYRRNK